MIIPPEVSLPEQKKRNRSPRDKLHGLTPQQRSSAKRTLVFDWIYRWHKTSAPIVQQLLGTSQRDYLWRLSKQGLLQAVDAPGLPIGKVWMLTKDGVTVAMEVTGEIFDYDTRPSSIDYADLRHDLAVQRAVFSVGCIDETWPDRILGADLPGQKRPDAIVIFWPPDESPGHTYHCAVEVELTPKKGRELDQALLAAGKLIEEQTVGSVEYFSPSLALLEHYKKVISRPINVWVKNETAKKWEIRGRHKMHAWVIDAFEWHHRPDLLKGLVP